MKQPNIVTFGGGTGSPVIIKSLIEAGFTNIKAISSATDSGGKTGSIRSDERDRVIAVCDLLRNLLALIPNHRHTKQLTTFTDLFSYTDGRNRNLGYTIYYALLEKYNNDFLSVQKHLEQLLSIRFAGTAIPVTLSPANLHFTTNSGKLFYGEHELDRQSMSKDSVKSIWLKPSVPATPLALEAISTADYLIYSPGSLYGSIIANFLPTGIIKALQQSSAHKILITNLVSTRNETHRFTPLDYLHLFRLYTRLDQPFDTIITPHLSTKEFNHRYPNIAHSYAQEHSHFLGWTKAQSNKLPSSIHVISANHFSITQKYSRLRHDPQKLGRILKKIISNR